MQRISSSLHRPALVGLANHSRGKHGSRLMGLGAELSKSRRARRFGVTTFVIELLPHCVSFWGAMRVSVLQMRALATQSCEFQPLEVVLLSQSREAHFGVGEGGVGLDVAFVTRGVSLWGGVMRSLVCRVCGVCGGCCGVWGGGRGSWNWCRVVVHMSRRHKGGADVTVMQTVGLVSSCFL